MSRSIPVVGRALAVGGAGLLSVGLVACSSSATDDDSVAQGYPLTVADCGAEITVNDLPERVFTVGSSAVEILDAAGASKHIVARSAEFGAPLPDTLNQAPDDALIVDPADPTTESIITADPDLVFGFGLFNADADQVRGAGIDLLTVQGECGHDEGTQAPPNITLNTISDDVRRVGTVFGTSAIADPAADALDKRISAARRESTGQSAAWVYYFSSEDPLSAYGGTGLPNSVLQDAGLRNVYAEEKDTYLKVSTESLLAQQPDWIVIKYGGYGETDADARAKFLAEPGVGALEAVRAGRIALLPAGSSNSAPSTVDSFEELVAATGDAESAGQ